MTPTLHLLNPAGPASRTLLVLHGNDGSTDVMRPRYADLTAQGWRVALGGSGQPVPDGPAQFRWNDLNATDEAVGAWVAELGTVPSWAGFSAGAWVALRAVLTGTLPGRGILAAMPSIPTHPDWWPQGWTAAPARVPCAFLVGETDDLTPPGARGPSRAAWPRGACPPWSRRTRAGTSTPPTGLNGGAGCSPGLGGRPGKGPPDAAGPVAVRQFTLRAGSGRV